ncbi:unnamed protein product [Vitrella brassicaformis CCMP3155]|uniref:F-box domain-containing protein n=1 Tax=Vitrella brassicaformis (strain CCMP3155) TaxID=1169540 RepID=A0A0G4EQT1_VITBC|nr:unnamed protein product [Vitrella brassicaformis CCMP3155]|eukprot:CEM00588.1 unnamed protein product [Vitrella brassicaformis CCMP3155]
MRPIIDWADKANVRQLVPLLKKIKLLEAQTAVVLSEVRPYVTPTLADKMPRLSNSLQKLDQSVVSRYDMLRGLIKTLGGVAVAKPPAPQPIANEPLPPDAIAAQPYSGRPSLDGLPPDVAHIVLALLPTKDAAPLSRVNKFIKQHVTDDTRGVYRHLVIGEDEREWRQREDETLHKLKQKLSRLRTVHDWDYYFDQGHVPTSPATVAFSQLEELYVEGWSFQRWQFPSLLRLQLGETSRECWSVLPSSNPCRRL